MMWNDAPEYEMPERLRRSIERACDQYFNEWLSTVTEADLVAALSDYPTDEDVIHAAMDLEKERKDGRRCGRE